ncbi:aminotransferase class V-fold PLP-dependent enzyme [Flagellimonas sp. S3867]|uniref:aminotransferase class V-fold PLP-dependent enzyme n=1 Tax=Flagellimonas sp. S3867 TaxID=2768063 RepID=UPI001688C7D9|nr:aminotransferase class V-fold PLP-dependent enzyme [Flagellimonas sp. S3867]
MQNLRKKFPVLKQCIYANTPATGLLYEDLLEWRQEHDLDYLIGGSNAKQKNFKNMFKIRDAVGRFFRCKSENVGLVPNFTLGLNILLEGLPKNSRVLLLENDYPSLNWPFETRNFNRDYVEIDGRLEENIYSKVESGKVDVLAFSMIQWINGIKIDLEFIKKLKKDYPNLLIIADGTQFCGTQAFDFSDSGIDVLGASGYKWLLAGYGNGFILVSEMAKERFEPKFIGNGSVDRDIDKRNSIPFCKYLEPGHLDSFNFGSLEFSLNFLDTIGMDHIGAQLQKLSQKARNGFASQGLLENTVVDRAVHSTIFNIKGDTQLYTKLLNENVVCIPRGNGIRLGFHFYNTENEIDRIMDIIKS